MLPGKTIALDRKSAEQAVAIDSSIVAMSQQLAVLAEQEEIVRTEKLKAIGNLQKLREARVIAYNNIAKAHGIDLNEPGWFLESDNARFVRRSAEPTDASASATEPKNSNKTKAQRTAGRRVNSIR